MVIPPGKFKTGTIFLKDNVELHLDNGACLYASEDYADFPIQPRAAYRSLKDAGGWSALIYAVGARNIAVTGKGVIDGRGKGRKGVWAEYRVMPTAGRAISFLFHVKGYVSQVSV